MAIYLELQNLEQQTAMIFSSVLRMLVRKKKYGGDVELVDQAPMILDACQPVAEWLEPRPAAAIPPSGHVDQSVSSVTQAVLKRRRASGSTGQPSKLEGASSFTVGSGLARGRRHGEVTIARRGFWLHWLHWLHCAASRAQRIAQKGHRVERLRCVGRETKSRFLRKASSILTREKW
jgi:hypothetical protein